MQRESVQAVTFSTISRGEFLMTRPLEIKVGLSPAGVNQIEVFADTQQDRDEALRIILKVSPEIRALETAVAGSENLAAAQD